MRYIPNMLRILLVRFAVIVSIGAALSRGVTQPSVKTPLAPLPETITSFGAVTADGWLYVFGGHKGKRHEYSAEEVSGSFDRLQLSDGRHWQSLPPSVPGQGLALVAHGHDLYRIGGMAAQNHEGAKQDLHSTSLVQRFGFHNRRWQDIAPLPEPRSSHDAVVLGNKLYVAGGWDLTGGTNKPIWLSNAAMLDLSRPRDGWK